MPKFSAYMRGGRGAAGKDGQGTIFDGIVDTPEQLPVISPDDNFRNYAYYVGTDPNYYELYIHTTTESTWRNLGYVKGPQGNVGDPTAEAYSISSNLSATTWVDVTGTSTNKEFNFHFGIPEGRAAGFGNIDVTTSTLPSASTAVVSISTEGPEYAKNFDFYFGVPQGKAASFSTLEATAETLSYTESVTVSLSSDGEDMAKNLHFHFGIPHGEPADFGTPQASISTLSPEEEATVSITSRGTATSKIFDFHFGVPQGIKGDTGEPAGFGNITTSVSTLSSSSEATVEVIASGSSEAKDFDFHFGIPHGEAADFGTPTATAETLSWDSDATVSVSSSGSATAKEFSFHFGIPRGQAGDALAVYEPVTFTSTDNYWNGTTLYIPRGDNKKIPIYIFNNANNSIAATFQLSSDYIIYQADEKFDGTIYLVAQTNKSTIKVGNVTATDYESGTTSVTLNPNSSSTEAIFDFILQRGPIGNSPTITVDNEIEIIPSTSTPEVETTTTSTGVNLKFKLPLSTGTYTTTEIDNFLADKANVNDVYTTTQVDTILEDKADITDLSDLADVVDEKQDILSWDTTPTAESINPVTSGGIKTALDAKANTADVYSKTEANERYLAKKPASIELIPQAGTTNGGYIDFHYDGSDADYTTRIIEGENYLNIAGKPILTGNPILNGTPTLGNPSAWRDALKCECLIVNCGTISSLPTTITNENIESDMVVLKSVFGYPPAQIGNWTVETKVEGGIGKLTISGSINGSTSLTLYLIQSR